MNSKFEISELSVEQAKLISGGGCPVLGTGALVGLAVAAGTTTFTFLSIAFRD